MIGETIGNFRIVSRLGKGGMGEVFLAEQVAIHTKVAVKVLHEDISSDTDQVNRFFNEARIVGRIKHAGIVKIFDCGLFRGHAYLIMELLEGESLARRLEDAGRIPTTQLAEIGRQIASILDATHRAGITHRDLKPDNIFLVPDEELASGERVKILDFGIAKLSGTLAGNSPKTQGTLGTPSYMAPEQWGDSGNVDWRADAYSLGCVAFEMGVGRPPFRARTIAEAYSKHLNDPIPSACLESPELPAAFDTLVASLLAKRAEDRTMSMTAIAAAFEALVGQPPAPRVRKLGEPPPPAPLISLSATTLGSSHGEIGRASLASPRRGPVVAAIGGVVVVVAIVVGVVVAMHGDAPAVPPAKQPTIAIDAAPAVALAIDAAPAPTPAPVRLLDAAPAPVVEATPPVDKPVPRPIEKPKPRPVAKPKSPERKPGDLAADPNEGK